MTHERPQDGLRHDACLFPELFSGTGADLLPVQERASAPKGKGAGPAGLRHRAGHDPRAAALVALSRVLWDGADSQAALNDALGDARSAGTGLVPTDRALCTELLYGTLRRFLSLQSFAAGFLARPEKLPSEMRLTLVLSLYESAFLRTPHHAGVNWAVSQVRNRFGKGLAGVANGALRAMLRALPDLHEPSPKDAADASIADADNALGLRYAMPVWIVRLLRARYADEAVCALLEASIQGPPAGLRVNMARPGWQSLKDELMQSAGGKKARKRDALAATADDTSETGAEQVLAVGDCALAFFSPLPGQSREPLRLGRASRQSAASYAALHALGPADWPQPLWDCCAGRGGKSLPLLERGIAVALASDIAQQRLSGLSREYARLGLASPPCPALRLFSAADAAAFPGEALVQQEGQAPAPPEQFGTVLVDAPCSGLGTLARHPEIRLRRTPADLEGLVRLQASILDSVWTRLRPGGVLAYITCTVNPAENEEQTAAFLQRHPDARLEKEYPVEPHSQLREFFYGALLRKEG